MIIANLSIHDCKEKAHQGEAFFQYQLGLCFWEGWEVNQDYKTAMDWFRAATKQKSSLPHYLMGIAYFNGLGVRANFEKSFNHYLLAAKLMSHRDAYVRVGKALQLGLGVKQNYEIAEYWYKKGVELDYPPAQLALGILYQDINYSEHNTEDSFLWMLKAAENDVKEAQIRIALKFKNGEGTEPSTKKAIHWLEKSCLRDSRHTKYLFYKYSGFDNNDTEEQNEFMSNSSIKSIIADLKKHG